MVEEAGDGEGADAAVFRGEGGEIFAVSDAFVEVADEDTFFARSAGIDDDGARLHIFRKNQVRGTRCRDDYITLI